MHLSNYISLGKKIEAYVLPAPPLETTPTIHNAPKPEQLPDAHHFKSYIKDVDERHRYLIDQPPIEQIDLRHQIRPNTWLRLHIFTGQGQVQCIAPVQEIQGYGLAGYWLHLPDETPFNYVQRRQFVRVTTWDNVTLHVYDVESQEYSHDIAGQAHNISGNGIRFSSPNRLTPGTQHGITLHTEHEDFELWGDVVYCHKNPNKRAPAKEQFIIAMHLLNTPRQVERSLVKYCFKLEREREARQNYP